VVRHPLVQSIIRAYDRWDVKREPPRPPRPPREAGDERADAAPSPETTAEAPAAE
jgi:hypothetical protein